MIRRPPRTTRTDTLFPYTTLCRSKILAGRSLASLRMEALSDWGPNPRKLKPSEIDWPAVAAGEQVLRLRELPGRSNSMGKVKFLFPNDAGIYLHDTPDRALLGQPDPHFSTGCIRPENAAKLGPWLLPPPTATTPTNHAHETGKAQ